MRKSVHPIQEFDGIRFYKKPDGYYKACHSKGNVYLHRYVWEFHHGPVPAGFHVHHKNHLRADCRIENLELVAAEKHAAYHGETRDIEQLRDHMRNVMQPAAAVWHSSDKGLEFHKALGKHSWAVRNKTLYKCVHCESDFEAYVNAQKAGYCSARCQSAARRASGVDNISIKCRHCQVDFVKNKYSKQVYCGRSCFNSDRKTNPTLDTV